MEAVLGTQTDHNVFQVYNGQKPPGKMFRFMVARKSAPKGTDKYSPFSFYFL